MPTTLVTLSPSRRPTDADTVAASLSDTDCSFAATSPTLAGNAGYAPGNTPAGAAIGGETLVADSPIVGAVDVAGVPVVNGRSVVGVTGLRRCHSALAANTTTTTAATAASTRARDTVDRLGCAVVGARNSSSVIGGPLTGQPGTGIPGVRHRLKPIPVLPRPTQRVNRRRPTIHRPIARHQGVLQPRGSSPRTTPRTRPRHAPSPLKPPTPPSRTTGSRWTGATTVAIAGDRWGHSGRGCDGVCGYLTPVALVGVVRIRRRVAAG